MINNKIMTDDRDKILQNLKDADCDKELITQFFQLAENNRINELLKLLSAQRKTLVNRLHASQRQIDCLDYLIYEIKQEHSCANIRC